VGLAVAVTEVIEESWQVMFWKLGDNTEVGAFVLCVTLITLVVIQPDVGCTAVIVQLPVEVNVSCASGPKMFAISPFDQV
jgi:hypothetical protein